MVMKLGYQRRFLGMQLEYFRPRNTIVVSYSGLWKIYPEPTGAGI